MDRAIIQSGGDDSSHQAPHAAHYGLADYPIRLNLNFPRQGSLLVALVNQSFAARFFQGENPIGKRLRSIAQNQPNDWLAVAGVAPNVMQNDALRQQFKPLVYLPLRQRPSARAFFLVRTGMTTALASEVRAEVQKIDPDVSLEEMIRKHHRSAGQRDGV